MTSFLMPTRFSFLNKNNVISPHIAESANIAKLFGKKLSALLGRLYSNLNSRKYFDPN
jgi:hypothetical protein